VIKLVPVNRSSTRIVSLRARILRQMGIDPDRDLYGRWKIVEVDGQKMLVLDLYPA